MEINAGDRKILCLWVFSHFLCEARKHVLLLSQGSCWQDKLQVWKQKVIYCKIKAQQKLSSQSGTKQFLNTGVTLIMGTKSPRLTSRLGATQTEDGSGNSDETMLRAPAV